MSLKQEVGKPLSVVTSCNTMESEHIRELFTLSFPFLPDVLGGGAGDVIISAAVAHTHLVYRKLTLILLLDPTR